MKNVILIKNCRKQNKNISQKARIQKYNVITAYPQVKMRIMVMIMMMMMKKKKNEIYLCFI